MPAGSTVRSVAKAAALAAAVLVITLPGLAQQPQDQDVRRTGGNATCMDCHRAEGMQFVDTFPDRIREVPAGETFTVNVTIANPWLHHVDDARVGFNLSRSDVLSFAGGREPHLATHEGSVNQTGGTRDHAVPVAPGATEAVLTLEGDSGNGLNDWDLGVEAPSGDTYNASDDSAQDAMDGEETWSEQLRLDQETLLTGGPGNWTATVRLSNGGPPFNSYTLDVQVYYNASEADTLFVSGPDRLDEGQKATFGMEIEAAENASGSTTLATNVTMLAVADVPADHPPSGIPNIQNVGDWWVYQNQSVEVGDELVKQQPEVTTEVGGVNPFILLRSYAFISGFTALFLLPLALTLGGTFGGWSVRWMDRRMGARRRVLWHNATSFLLLAVAILHMGMFLFEPTREWTKGLLFGGLSLAALSGLAVSGSFQQRFIRRYGFSAWRFIHLSLAILMVLFVTLHTTVEGTDFQFVRDLLGAS
jgi:thiosulfate reductase cytochrome b subunit